MIDGSVGGEELRAPLRELAAVLRAVPLAVLIAAEHGEVLAANEAAERVFMCRGEELVGERFGALLSHGSQEEFARGIEAALHDGRWRDLGATHSVHARRPDGRVFLAEVRVSPLRTTEGRFVVVVVAARDAEGLDALVVEGLAAQRRVDARLIQTQKMETIGLLAGGIAHDFNNWLTVVRANCDLLLEAIEEGRAERDLVVEVRDVAERATSLTRQLLTFSRTQVVEPRSLDLAEVLAEAGKLLRRLLGEDVTLRTEVPEGRCFVWADAGQIVQVLMNLAVNARDAMPRGGVLTMRAASVALAEAEARCGASLAPGEWIHLAVRDTGTGMTPEIRARIFEPFFTTKGVGRGTGLGLSVVQGIVAQSGGHLGVETSLGAGTTFHVFLPAHDAAVAADRPTRPQERPRGTEVVLLAEDEEVVRRIGCRLLRLEGYRVLDAADGAEALAVLRASPAPIDLLITDVIMPGMDGAELAREASRRAPDIKVLFVSGYTDDATLSHGVRRGETAFLQKPYTRASLLRKVREVLDGA